MNLSERAISRPLATTILIAAACLFGLFSVGRVPLTFLPEISRPNLVVSTSYRSSSPEDVYQLITAPLEGALGGLEHLNAISSTSGSSQSTIRLEFDLSTNLDFAVAEIRDTIDQVRSELPADVGSIRVRRFQTTDLPIITFSVAGGGDLRSLYEAAETVIVPRLLRLDGVADVDLSGIRSEEITIELDEERMLAAGISVSQVSSALSANNVTESAGTVIEDGRRYVVRSLGELVDEAQIAALPVGGSGIRVGDIASVNRGLADQSRYQRLNGRDAVAVQVFKTSSANVVEVSNQVKELLSALGSEGDTADLQLVVFFDQAREITGSLNNLRNAGIIGAGMAVMVLFLFLRKISSTLVIGLAIPVSIVCTFACLFLLNRWGTDISLNIISLAGLMLAVGMLVDNSVVVLENIFRHREAGAAPMQAAVIGSREVAMPVTAATLTSIIVFVPLVFTANTSFGRFTRDFGLSIIAALAASLLVSLTLVPLLSSRVLRQVAAKPPRFISALRRWYGAIMRWGLRRRLLVVLATTAMLGGGLYLFRLIEQEFTPPAPSRQMNVSVSVPRDWTIEQIDAVVAQAEALLLERRDELEIATLSADVRESGRSRLSIYFRDVGASQRSTADLTNEVRALFPAIPGVTFAVGRGFGIGGDTSSVSVQLQGPQTSVLELYADDIAGQLAGVPGLQDVETNLETGDEEVRIKVDRDKSRSLGISPNDVAQSVRAALSESGSGTLQTQNGEIPIRVFLDSDSAARLDRLEQVGVDGSYGTVPAGTLFTVEQAAGPVSIRRQDGLDVLDVSANTDRRGMRALEAEIERSMNSVRMPPGYSSQIGSRFRQFRESQQTSLFSVVLAVVFVYLIMASLFESFLHPITILFSVPFSLLGVAVLFFLTGTTLNSNSWLGIMVLFGVVVNNAIILIDHVNRLRATGMERTEAIVTGGQDRLRPILVTAVTTLLGLTPAVAPILAPGIFGPTEGRANQYGPIALALIGGLTASTALTLVITPTIYSLMDDLARVIGRVTYTARAALRSGPAGPSRRDRGGARIHTGGAHAGNG